MVIKICITTIHMFSISNVDFFISIDEKKILDMKISRQDFENNEFFDRQILIFKISGKILKII